MTEPARAPSTAAPPGAVPADLHLDPERLVLLARRTAELLDVLVPPPALDPATREAVGAVPGGAGLLDALDALRGSAARTGREIGELAAHLAGAATAAGTADADTADAVRRIAERL